MANRSGLSREQAAQIYDQLRNTMEKRYGKKGLETLMQKDKAMKGVDSMAADNSGVSVDLSRAAARGGSATSVSFGNGGVRAAFALVLCIAGLKTGMSALEATGIVETQTAHAKMDADFLSKNSYKPHFSQNEVKLLKSLDQRRLELEERENLLDDRESEIGQKNREFAARLTELRELSHQLAGERKKSEHKKDAQLDQLANVYGSMNPNEAAQLIEQLDVTISLGLLERMPEKRIGQILSMMSPDRALTITRMLSSGD